MTVPVVIVLGLLSPFPFVVTKTTVLATRSPIIIIPVLPLVPVPVVVVHILLFVVPIRRVRLSLFLVPSTTAEPLTVASVPIQLNTAQLLDFVGLPQLIERH